MSRMTAARVIFELDHLELGRKLGEGGQGAVHEVRHTWIGGGAERASVVCKQYRDDQLPALDAEALHTMVGMVNGLTDREARWLSAHAAWPCAVVTREGTPVGFLMRTVPSEYMFEFPGSSGKTKAVSKLTAFEYLLNDDAYTARIGLSLDDRQRLALLASVAGTLAELHRLGVAVGDLSPKNLLFARPPARDCYLIDCDAFRLNGATVLPQAETPDWALPAGEEKGTAAGDVYKFGLLVVRLLARNQTSRDVAELRGAGSDKHLVRMLRRSLDPRPAHRPTARQWAGLLPKLASRPVPRHVVPEQQAATQPPVRVSQRVAAPPPRPAYRSSARVPARGTTRPPRRADSGRAGSFLSVVLSFGALVGVFVLAVWLESH